MGKIISSRYFLQFVVQEIAEKAWKTSHPIQVSKIDENIFLFSFGHEVDRQLAFNQRPWTIKGAHLVLKPCAPELSCHELDFTKSTFWVQIHGLPMLWKTKDNIDKIGQKIGYVLDIDLISEPFIQWRKFVRVRVELDTTKPLKKGLFLPRPELHDVCIGLKYEKLPNLCYKCGIIGHYEKDCSIDKALIANQHGVNFPAFGGWIRPENDKKPHNIYSKPTFPTSPSIENLPSENALALPMIRSSVGPTLGEDVGLGKSEHAPGMRDEILLFATLLASSFHRNSGISRSCMEPHSHLECQNVGDIEDKNAQLELLRPKAGITQVTPNQECLSPITTQLAQPNIDNWPTLTSTDSFSLISPNTLTSHPNQPTSPTHTHITTHLPDIPDYKPSPIIIIDNPPSLKWKTPLEEPLTHKKPKLDESVAEAINFDPGNISNSPKPRIDHYHKGERNSKKNRVASPKLSLNTPKSYGYSFGVVSSKIFLPKLEGGFIKPPPPQ